MPYFHLCNTARMKRLFLYVFIVLLTVFHNVNAEEVPTDQATPEAPSSADEQSRSTSSSPSNTQTNPDIPQERLEEISLDQLTVLAKNGDYDQGYKMSDRKSVV